MPRCPELAAAKHCVQEQQVLLETLRSTLTLLQQDVLRNTRTLGPLNGSLAAAQDDEIRAAANVEALELQLASLREVVNGCSGRHIFIQAMEFLTPICLCIIERGTSSAPM